MNISNFGEQTEKPFHSHAYVDAAAGGSIGSTNTQTFGQRYSVERNRSSVRSYQESHIGRGPLSPHTRSGAMDYSGRLDPSAANSLRRHNMRGSTTRPGGPSQPSTPPRPSFREPPARGFNPYA